MSYYARDSKLYGYALCASRYYADLLDLWAFEFKMSHGNGIFVIYSENPDKYKVYQKYDITLNEGE